MWLIFILLEWAEVGWSPQCSTVATSSSSGEIKEEQIHMDVCQKGVDVYVIQHILPHSLFWLIAFQGTH